MPVSANNDLNKQLNLFSFKLLNLLWWSFWTSLPIGKPVRRVFISELFAGKNGFCTNWSCGWLVNSYSKNVSCSITKAQCLHVLPDCHIRRMYFNFNSSLKTNSFLSYCFSIFCLHAWFHGLWNYEWQM